MGGGDGPLAGYDAASTPVAPAVAAVAEAALPRPRMLQRLHAADDARVLGRDAAAAAVLMLQRQRQWT